MARLWRNPVLGFAGHRYNDRTSSVYISGGKVTVEPYFSVGFASFASVDVQISGGTVIFDKGASEASTWDSTFTITGGSINPNSAQVEAINGSTTPVYPTKVQLEGIVSPTGVSSLSIDSGGAGYDYGTNDMLTDSSGYLYLYLPEGATMSTAITGSAKYTGTVTTDTSNSASGVLILDTAAPTVQNVTILNSNGTLASNEAAPLEGKVQIAFCEEMRPYEGAVALNGNALSSGEWSGDNTVYAVPYSGLSYSTTYTVQVSGFKDYSGNTMTEADSHSFTTVTALVVDGDASGYEYKDGVLTFKAPGDYTVSMNTGVTTTTDRIVVNAGTEEDPVNITLNGVSIVRSEGGNAFELTNGATVNLLLKGNNSLIAQASMSSGLRVPNGTSVAIDAIDADGSLYAEGGMRSAAIGGGRVTTIGTITINGGKITAYAEGYGAAIGSGMDVLAASGRVEINGEKVEATSILGCGIGGGVNSLFDAIIISGGEVVAGSFGEVTAAIGNANAIDISGGEVNATFVGNADYYNGGCGIGRAGEIHISGGEVNASSTYVSTDSRSSVGIGHSGAVFINGGLVNATGKTEGIFMAGTLSIGGGTVTATADAAGTGILVYLDSPIEITGGSVNATSISLVRSDGNTDFIDIANDVGDKVYLTKVRLGGISSATRVLSLSVDLNGVAYSYGLNDVYTDDLGYLYLYLPQGARVTAARTASNSYAGVVATDATGASDGTLAVVETPTGSSSGSSTAPSFRAITSSGRSLSVNVSAGAKHAIISVDNSIGELVAGGGNETIEIPPIPGVDSYSVTLPVGYLAASGGGSLTLKTDAGSITLPGNMLTGIDGERAQVTIGRVDVTALPAGVREKIGNRPVVQLELTVDGEQRAWNNPEAPVTISIPYTPTDEELANPDSIVVWYVDGNGNLVCITNGRYDPESGAVTFTTTHFSHYAVGYNPVQFSDVPEDAWYYGAVRFIAARGITNGTGDGEYDPEAPLKRADLVVLLMRAYEIAPDEEPADNFADAGDTYYTGYLGAAKRLGIAKGVGDNLFAPEREITRQETFTLMYNTLKAVNRLPEGISGKALSDFSDGGEVAEWAVEAMARLVEAGIVNGNGGLLEPMRTTTRAEMAQLLHNLLGK